MSSQCTECLALKGARSEVDTLYAQYLNQLGRQVDTLFVAVLKGARRSSRTLDVPERGQSF